MTSGHVSSDDIRTRFSKAMSNMYSAEVPQYSTLTDLVREINAATLASDPELEARLARADDLERINLERHGAIRLGTAEELSTVRRLFAVMGMTPVGYYDLSIAGVPVHSTAFRPLHEDCLARNPFRVFASLLRLELVEDEKVRHEAEAILAQRSIFTRGTLDLIARFEQVGGLTDDEADVFVADALHTFRWHGKATVDAEAYRRLGDAHRLVADVVSFKGPHINHLTPRTLDIDKVQAAMPRVGIAAKDVIEGPPRRACPILLRQTSFKALEEQVSFEGEESTSRGTHTARFGEVEQRGLALTRQGRELYDALLDRARRSGTNVPYHVRLEQAFEAFPDDYDEIRKRGLGYFRYSVADAGQQTASASLALMPLEALVAAGFVKADPMVYEDFLPVSAAGIFQSNLGTSERRTYAADASKQAFVDALGAVPLDEFDVYEMAQARSIGCVWMLLQTRESTQVSPP